MRMAALEQDSSLVAPVASTSAFLFQKQLMIEYFDKITLKQNITNAFLLSALNLHTV